MKTYVLTVSQSFPATHKNKGKPTGFIMKINNKTKLHAIRGNYELWKKRFEKIAAGEARLSVRVWTGSPYNYAKDGSKQEEVFSFDRRDGIGLQKLQFDIYLGWFIDDVDSDVNTSVLAANDGLNKEDFLEWFKEASFRDSMAIIHFTKFRY